MGSVTFGHDSRRLDDYRLLADRYREARSPTRPRFRRPRPEDTPIGDWADVLRELPTRVAEWIDRLQAEGIRGADLVFACIGPALEIFSRYRAIETAEGDIIGLPDYLEKVWEVVGRAALQQVLGTAEAQTHGALEQDARLTALFLWTLQSTTPVAENQEQDDEADEEAVAKAAATGFALPFDVVRRFAQPMGIDLAAQTDRIIGQEKGVVRLLPVAERAKKLFGEDGAAAAATYLESGANAQQTLFPAYQEGAPTLVREPPPRYDESPDDPLSATLGDTTLDRVHTAMLLQSSGHATALRTLISTEQDAAPTSSALPTPSPPSTLKAPPKNASSTPCCWRCRGDALFRDQAYNADLP